MKKLTLISLLLLFSVATSWAAPVPKYNGRVEFSYIDPHKSDNKGIIEFLFEGDVFNSVHLKLEKKFFNKDDFTSKDQALVIKKNKIEDSTSVLDGDNSKKTEKVREEDILRFSGLYQLKGAPHKWFFVFVARPSIMSDVIVLKGAIYKVDLPRAQIMAKLEEGFAGTPEGWKLLGSVEIN